MKTLILAKVPESVSTPVPEPVTMTPPPSVASKVPLGTEKPTVTLALPASTSLKLMPLSTLATSSVTVMLPGTVTTGASFTGLTLRVMVLVSVLTLPVSTAIVSVTSAVALAAVV